MVEAQKSLFDNLQNFFGFDNFKGEQEAIITNILSGNDTFVIMPTGGGKSLCYQLPALMSEGTAIVISPLSALKKNQVDQIRAFGGSDSIAHFLNSSLTKADIGPKYEDVLEGKTKLICRGCSPRIIQPNRRILIFYALTRFHLWRLMRRTVYQSGDHDFRPRVPQNQAR